MNTAPTRQITLFDAVCLIVGIMVGAGIFESSPVVAQHSTGPAMLLGMWLLGGALSLVGALTYAGLATRFPETGGDYAFLKRAFGLPTSFLYGWAMLVVVRPGNIGAMAYVFARYANEIIPVPHGLFVYAVGAIVLLAALNLLGTREGKGVQNILTTAKVLGIVFLILVALGSGQNAPALPPTADPTSSSFTLALIFVLFAYGGWNEIAFVAAEVKDPQRNLLRSLVLGTVFVTALYVIVNAVFLNTVGFTGLRRADAVAHTVAELRLSSAGGLFVSALIAVSALGAVHGMLFSGARIYYALGQDHAFFAPLGRWSRRGLPVWSIVVETLITLAVMALFFGSPSGFESLILFSTPLFWVFMLLVGISAFPLLGLRTRAILGHPWTALLFIGSCLFMLGMSLDYAYRNVSAEIGWSLALLAVGVVIERVYHKKTLRKGGSG